MAVISDDFLLDAHSYESRKAGSVPKPIKEEIDVKRPGKGRRTGCIAVEKPQEVDHWADIRPLGVVFNEMPESTAD